MFAIMGITGKVGGAVAQTLLERGKKVRGIVRDAAKARDWQAKGVEIVTSEWDADLSSAFSGVEGVFVMIPPNMLPEPGFPDSVARAAAIRKGLVAAQPPKVVALSSWGSEQSEGLGLITPNRILEQQLAGTGIPTAVLRPAWFIENIIYSLSTAQATGNYYSFYQPLERPYDMVATKDVGRVGGETLVQHWQGTRIIEIAGPSTYSSLDAAAALEVGLGRPIQAVAVPRDQWVQTLEQNGMPANRSGAYLEMVDGLNCGWIHFGVAGTETAKGTTELVTAVKALVASSHKD